MVALIDTALVHRIERMDAAAALEQGRVLAEIAPSVGAAALEIGGGVALFAGVGSPVTQTFGLGLSSVPTADELDAVERFYRSRGSPAVVVLASHVPVEVLHVFSARGYGVVEIENVLVRPLDDADLRFEVPAHLEIGTVDVRDMDLWARTVASGFLEGAEPPDEWLTIFRPMVHRRDARCYLTRIGGEAVGGGASLLRDGLTLLCGCSTLPAWRGRGSQTALVGHRLAEARRAGCDLAVVGTLPGTASQRNVEKHGFRLAYARVKLVRAWTE